MISSVTNVNGGKRITITNNGKVVIDLPEGVTFTTAKVGASTVISVQLKEGFSLVQEHYRKYLIEEKSFDVNAQSVKCKEENPDVLKKKRQFSPRLTPEQKADVIKLHREGMGKTAIARTMKITFQQVNYCLKTFA